MASSPPGLQRQCGTNPLPRGHVQVQVAPTERRSAVAGIALLLICHQQLLGNRIVQSQPPQRTAARKLRLVTRQHLLLWPRACPCQSAEPTGNAAGVVNKGAWVPVKPRQICVGSVYLLLQASIGQPHHRNVSRETESRP
jgi:hypothetical protein